MKHLKHTIVYIAVLAATPSIASAATFRTFVVQVTDFVGDALMPLLFSAALAYFIWGVVEFIRSADNSDERNKGKSRILWGIIGLFAMLTYLGLTSVFTSTFFGTNVFLPQLFTGSN
jgi:membrane protease YdiL (CAAX protease family)